MCVRVCVVCLEGGRRLHWSTTRPQCLPVQPSLKQTLYWIKAGPRVRAGRGKLNRGEKGVSRLFQVDLEFGASVFVSNWLFSGLTDILPSLGGRAEVSGGGNTGGCQTHDCDCCRSERHFLRKAPLDASVQRSCWDEDTSKVVSGLPEPKLSQSALTWRRCSCHQLDLGAGAIFQPLVGAPLYVNVFRKRIRKQTSAAAAPGVCKASLTPKHD